MQLEKAMLGDIDVNVRGRLPSGPVLNGTLDHTECAAAAHAEH
jgi:hypothetical protein